jgi:hypothetical protein
MLREIADVQQREPGLRRRWFRDDYFDIFVWQSPLGAFVSLQLCYDLSAHERILVWREGHGYAHHGIDSGESTPFDNRSPMMVADGVLPVDEVLAQFGQRSAELEPALQAFIAGHLRAYAAGAV